MISLSKSLENYLSLRRRFGFKLKQEGKILADFLSFLKQQGASYITTTLAVRWAVKPKNAQLVRWAHRFSMIRLFAKYHSMTDPRTEVPPQDLISYHYHRKTPYIYTDEEIIHLLKAARQLPSTVWTAAGLRAWTYSTFFGLLAVTGMRLGEAVALNREDIDLKQGIIIVRGAKFNKLRLLPIHKSTQRALQQYTHQRDRLYPKLKTPSFFISEYGRRLSCWSAQWTFVRLSREIGLRGPSDSHGPRIHDFRHRFAVQTLLRWYRNSVDVEQQLPKLSTYLGHVHVTGTYWYLTATPELLRLAAMRLKHTKGGLLS